MATKLLELTRQGYSVEEAATILGVGRSTAWRAVKSGELPSIRLCHRVVVPRPALDRLLAGEHHEQPGGVVAPDLQGARS